MIKKSYLLLLFLVFLFLVKGEVKAASLQTSGVVYNSDSSADISRSRSTSVRIPENILSPVQGWVAVRMRMGFSFNTGLSPDPIIWDLSESDPRDLFVYFDAGSDEFHFARNSGAGGIIMGSDPQSFSTGDIKTIIAAWTSSQLKISIDGASFITANTSSIPNQSPFFVGSTQVQGSGRQPNSDYFWVAAGTGTLNDSDASLIHSFANSDKRRIDFPGNAVFVWWAESDTYNNDGGVVASPTPTSGVCSKAGDANCDGKVDGFDYVTWWQNFGTSKSGPAFGDFNNSGFVDGFDYVIWWQNFGK